MASRIFPSENDVHDTTGQGRKPTEANLIGLGDPLRTLLSHYRDGNQIEAGGVLSGFDFNAGTATSITLNAGTAMIQGYRCEESTTITGVLTANTFNFVFLTVDQTASKATDLSLTVVTAATFNASITPPTDPSILIHCFETDGTSIITQFDFRQVGSGVMYGSYVGDDAATRTINLGFRPKLVQVHRNEDYKFVAQSPLAIPRVSGQQRGLFSGNGGYSIVTNDPEHIPVLTEDGFTIQDGPATIVGPRVVGVGTKTHDFPSINAGLTSTTTFAVTGAATTDLVTVGLSSFAGEPIILHATVTSAGVVTVYAHNAGSSPVDLASGTLSVVVFDQTFQPKLNELAILYYFVVWF